MECASVVQLAAKPMEHFSILQAIMVSKKRIETTIGILSKFKCKNNKINSI